VRLLPSVILKAQLIGLFRHHPGASHFPRSNSSARPYFSGFWTSTLTLVSTGKLDLLTTLVAPLAILYKGFPLVARS